MFDNDATQWRNAVMTSMGRRELICGGESQDEQMPYIGLNPPLKNPCGQTHRAEQHEFEKWRKVVVIESRGANPEEFYSETQDMLHRFIDYTRTNKVVLIEELGARFGVASQDMVTRLETLERSGSITGVMDDRGKFICITAHEMTLIAGYFKTQGRLSISELAGISNNTIKM
ncbi:hypothetical protein N9M16_03285 [Candidatus Dependentiae bacterium]|jgi:hypothetical protein|nr:hypothetical protein [Candidatus Dependentiae bacterium]|mmetsp:Transcript_12436/g.56638  ORF Transcript_12436/g.56638 Transcript_12436/m.56638 type:complete len:173 (+) Transcript_12436:475-993(+)